MPAATKSSTTPRSPFPRPHKTSTTPHSRQGTRAPQSAAQSVPPRLTPALRSPAAQQEPRSPSPSYFGLIVDSNENPNDSNAGQHAKRNWKSPSSSINSKVTPKEPVPVPHESNPDYEEFRKQSEIYAFNLNSRNFSGLSQLSNNTPSSPLAKEPMRNVERTETRRGTDTAVSPRHMLNTSVTEDMEMDDGKSGGRNMLAASQSQDQVSFFDIPRNETPETVPDVRRNRPDIDDRHPRLSLPNNRLTPTSPEVHPKRAETLPSSLSKDGPTMVEPKNIEALLNPATKDNNVLLLDLRVNPQFAQSRIKGALNLCIPTTLLKRPSFNLQRLMNTFTDPEEKARFSRWNDVDYIIVYDANSPTVKDAVFCVNTLKKFTTEGWQGSAFILRGGFKEAAKSVSHLIESQSGKDAAKNLSLQSGNSEMPVAGGCPMPATKTAANPFFGNIRQNMDLIGGVGREPLKIPEALGQRGFEALPKWLRSAAEEADKGKAVSEMFLKIEKEEQSRMQTALSGHVSYGTPGADAKKTIQIAGIEKGTKNRYKDMLPYDHSRVKLRIANSSDCDYINASHVKAEWSNRRYIATQAPVPATFEDFWRVVWEQEARVLIMLTAEKEGAQLKCHPYWVPGDYGPMKVKALSEKRVALKQPSALAAFSKKAQLGSPFEKPAAAVKRRATNPHGAAAAEAAREGSADADSSEPAHVIVRTLALSHSSFPFQPMREVVQIQFSQWPDFGTPAHANDILGIVEHANKFAREYRESKTNPQLPATENEPPMLVHCSAGCGRTGTFCTIDSVIDMLKRQRLKKLSETKANTDDSMEVDSKDWELSDDIDLVKKAVEDFRLQRLSMVQTLRQFVLCYEAVLEWLVKESPEIYKRDAVRRSFHG